MNLRMRRPSLCVIALFAPMSLHAAIVCHEQELSVPQTGEGIYINFVTAQSGGSEGAVPGFDFNPYAQQSSTPPLQLRFYWGSPSTQGAGVASSGDRYAVLEAGDTIDASSLFTRMGAGGDTSAWQSGVDAGYLGVRFTNEATSLLSYGWVRLSTTAPLGFPASVIDWCYESSGAGITIPAAADAIFCDGFDGTACPADPP